LVQLKWGKSDAVRRMRREEAATGAGEREIEKERSRKRERGSKGEREKRLIG